MAATVKGLCDEARTIMDRLAPLTDLVIVCADGVEFAVSKSMVAAPSVVLANMFADLKTGVKAKTRGKSAVADDRVTLEDSSSTVVMLINHAYAGPRFKVTNLNVGPCVRAAVKYDMQRLLEACHEYLDKLRLTLRILPGWLNSAPTYQLPRFTTRCVTFAAANLQRIIDTRVELKRGPTDWLEKLPPSTLVELFQLRTCMVGSMATCSILGKRDKPLTDEEVVHLEKQARTF